MVHCFILIYKVVTMSSWYSLQGYRIQNEVFEIVYRGSCYMTREGGGQRGTSK